MKEDNICSLLKRSSIVHGSLFIVDLRSNVTLSFIILGGIGESKSVAEIKGDTKKSILHQNPLTRRGYWH
jgi:hypothetical protein